MIRQGKISAKIQFREREEMKELSDDCNNLTSDLREKFVMIKKQTMLLKDKTKDSEEIRKIEDVLSTLQLEAETIEIHTSTLRVVGEKKQ
jgi:hypothetical protein